MKIRALSKSLFVALFTVSFPVIAELYFPPVSGHWETTSPEAANLKPGNVERAVEYAESGTTSSLLILHDGRIVSEYHWSATDDKGNFSMGYKRGYHGENALGHPIEDVASVQKSFISLLAGIAVTEGKLDLMARASDYLGEGWSKASVEQESAIQVWHLMTMTTGLGNRLEYQVAPGTRWAYNTNSYSEMVPVLEKAFGAPIETITRERIAAPIGMSDTHWTAREWAKNSVIANAIGLATTARDLGRFGILVQAGGEWDGTTVLDNPTYLKQSLSPSQTFNPAYGLLWWLNGQHSYLRPNRGESVAGSMIPSAPDDMVFAAGALGRKVYIAPSLGLVVIRMGDQHSADFDEGFWARLLGRK